MISSIKKNSPFALGSPALVWQIIFFYFPLALMIITSLLKFSQEGAFEGFSFENFTPLLTSTYLVIILHSLCLALSTAILCLLIAYPMAHFITFKGKRYKHILLFFLIVPFWTNFLLHVYAWFFVLEKEGFLNNLLISTGIITQPIHFLNSLFSIMIMMVYYYLPFMVLPIYAALDRFDRQLLESSSDLGATQMQTIKRILLPLTMPAMRVGFFLVLIPAFGEFVIPELMGGDKKYFVGNVISQYILGEGTQGIGSAFTLLSILSLIAASLGVYLILNKISRYLKRGLR
ncbi:MAG: ABC transporter permease [Simkaniaceae bacterium]|nr:ABC transporter permease [Simkaniaceae bacterium]